ncbi:MAG: hypothetical protein LBU55_05075 [Elusimicrobiota bacterium]|jgi:hypothetical protein|nr:hypothetical protein [Elusimicrobiota bacterium]
MKKFFLIFKLSIVILLLVCPFLAKLQAAQEKISVHVTPVSAFVGDIIKFSVSVELPKGAYIGTAQNISFENFEIITSEILKLRAQENTYELNFYISAYKTGKLTINSLTVFYIDVEGSDNLFFTPEKVVEIKSIVATSANTVVTDIKDIKKPTKLRIKTIHALLIIIAIVAFFIAATSLVKNIIENIKKVKEIPLDNRTKSLMDLEELYNESSKITVKIFYYRMSEILRTYVSKTYKFDAMEMTTSEFFDKVKPLLPLEIDLAQFKQYLQVFNLARYADWLPTKEEIENNYSITKKLLELL